MPINEIELEKIKQLSELNELLSTYNNDMHDTVMTYVNRVEDILGEAEEQRSSNEDAGGKLFEGLQQLVQSKDKDDIKEKAQALIDESHTVLHVEIGAIDAEIEVAEEELSVGICDVISVITDKIDTMHWSRAKQIKDEILSEVGE